MTIGVLHICDKFGVAGSSIHGVSRLFSWWFPRYDPTRFEVTLCGLKSPEPASLLLQTQNVPVTHLGRGRFDPRILTDLVALGRQRGARILHVHGYAAADFGRLAARVLGAKLVLHEHFADPRMPGYQALADRLLRSLTHRAIAVSASTRDFLIRDRFVPRERVEVIWNGAPLDEFAPVPPERAEAFRREVGLPTSATVIGVIGRLSAQKGHRYFLQAAAQVAEARPDTHFLIVGDGDQEHALRRQARELGLEPRLVMTGHRSDIPDALGAIDILCISSTYEGTPLALFEAMASEKAIVSTAVDGCQEVLEDGHTGILVAPQDAGALALGLLNAVDQPAMRRTLARAAREASRRYDVSECVNQMQDLYDELLSERLPTRR
jgi:glycosyltransferase involved in cell wall biosynthesis